MKKNGGIVQVVMGAVIAVVLSIALAAITAALASGDKLQLESVKWIRLAINGTCVFIGCVIGMCTTQMKPVIASLIVCGTYLCWMVLTNWTVSEGLRTGWGWVPLIVVVAGAAACLLFAGGKSKRKRYH